MPFHPTRWGDLAPSRNAYDPVVVERVVRDVVAEAVGGDLSQKRLRGGFTHIGLEHAISQALVEACGVWTSRFTWSRQDGGPIADYCCCNHSILPGSDVDAHATVTRVVAAVAGLRAFLVELEARFDALHARTAAMALERAVEHAAADLVELTLARTDAEDAWYHTFTSLLGYYLEATGHASATTSRLVEDVIAGRFSSFCVPSSDVRAEVAAELGLEIALAHERAASAASTEDALAEWRGIRATAFEDAAYPVSIPMVWDGHLRFIEGPETERDEARARRMRTALDACRASARKGAALTLGLLSRLNGIVLGGDGAFRTGDAFAKGGRERYPFDPKTLRRLEGWLEEANDAATPVHVRAARVYLDLCYTHPFEDGNARTARLALDFVLFREGLVLRVVEPIFNVSRAADDADGARGLARMISLVSGRV